MSWLNGLRLALWKEWRDHRAMLIALFIALPALTALGFWAFGDRLGGASLRTQALIIVPIALGLVLFAIAGDLVAGEHRRGTMDVLRRVPGARTQAFAAKWLMLCMTMVGATLWLAFSWLLAWNVMAEAEQAGSLEFMLGAFPSGPFWELFWLGTVVCSWAFVVAHWLARSGAAAIASVLVLGMLLAPVAWIFWTHPYFMPFGPTHAPMIALALIAAAMGVSALSWFAGLRFHGASWKPGLLGLAAVVGLSGVAYAYTSHELDTWTEVDPQHEAFRIRNAIVSPNGKRLYLNVNRGEPWYAGQPVHGGTLSRWEWFEKRGTPIQAWIVNLETGEVMRDATAGQHTFTRTVSGGYTWSLPHKVVSPAGLVGRAFFDRKETKEVRWLDADTGEVIATLAPDLTSGPVEAARRDDLRRFASRLDRQGRRTWLRNGEVEREGQELALPPRPTKRIWALHDIEVPGGWLVFKPHEQRGWIRSFLDLETGSAREIEPEEWRSNTLLYLAGGRVLRMTRLKGQSPTMTICDATTGAVLQEARNSPPHQFGPVGRDRVLCARQTSPRNYDLHVWSPMTGESEPVRWSHPMPTENVNYQIRARLPDGRYLLELREPPQSHDPADYWMAYAALDSRTSEAEVLMVARHRDHRAQPLVVEEEGSLMVIEAERRIVRYRDPSTREIVWPKAE